MLDVLVDDRVALSVIADVFRQDLLDAGVGERQPRLLSFRLEALQARPDSVIRVKVARHDDRTGQQRQAAERLRLCRALEQTRRTDQTWPRQCRGRDGDADRIHRARHDGRRDGEQPAEGGAPACRARPVAPGRVAAPDERRHLGRKPARGGRGGGHRVHLAADAGRCGEGRHRRGRPAVRLPQGCGVVRSFHQCGQRRARAARAVGGAGRRVPRCAGQRRPARRQQRAAGDLGRRRQGGVRQIQIGARRDGRRGALYRPDRRRIDRQAGAQRRRRGGEHRAGRGVHHGREGRRRAAAAVGGDPPGRRRTRPAVRPDGRIISSPAATIRPISRCGCCTRTFRSPASWRARSACRCG